MKIINQNFGKPVENHVVLIPEDKKSYQASYQEIVDRKINNFFCLLVHVLKVLQNAIQKSTGELLHIVRHA